MTGWKMIDEVYCIKIVIKYENNYNSKQQVFNPYVTAYVTASCSAGKWSEVDTRNGRNTGHGKGTPVLGEKPNITVHRTGNK